eukprot:m51a1_g2072 hypothetical protein (742) ;mRNA; r:1473720-1476178
MPRQNKSIRCFGFKLGLGSLCVALIAGSVIVSVVPQWVVWYVQANASTRGVSRDLIRQIASKVMVALEFTISQAEQITSELALIAESAEDGCSDDINASAAVVQGRWRDYFNKVRLTERAGWAILAGDRHGPGNLSWGRFFIGLPSGRQLIAVSKSHGSIKEPNRVCGVRGVLMSVTAWQRFLREQQIGKTGNVWLIESDTMELFSTTKNTSLFVGSTSQRVFAINSTDRMTRDVGKYVAKFASGEKSISNDTNIVSIGGISCQVFVSLINIRPGTGFAPMYYVVVVPVDDYWGSINRGIVVTIIITVVLFVFSVVVAIAAGIIFVSRPLTRTSKTISRLSCLNMEDLAYVSGHSKHKHTNTGIASLSVSREENCTDDQATSRSRSSTSSDESLSRFGGHHLLSEVSDLLTSASKMAESLYAVGRYVSMDLCSWVIQNRVVEMPLAPKVITALFCDIQGSTAMIDRSKREGTMGEFGRMLNEILTTLANVAKRHGGYIDKLMGDEVMAIFNAPYECKDHQVHACAAALQMHVAVDDLCRAWDKRGAYKSFQRPRVRIGVAAGEVLVGDIGAFGTLTNFTAIGDTVCVASRLQSAAKVINPEGTGILLTGETWAAGGGQVGADNLVVRTVGCIKLRGPDLPILVSTVVGERVNIDDADIEAMRAYDSAMELFYNCEWAECTQRLKRIVGQSGSSCAAVRDAEALMRVAQNNIEHPDTATNVTHDLSGDAAPAPQSLRKSNRL